jgi:hypothetical protein
MIQTRKVRVFMRRLRLARGCFEGSFGKLKAECHAFRRRKHGTHLSLGDGADPREAGGHDAKGEGHEPHRPVGEGGGTDGGDEGEGDG